MDNKEKNKLEAQLQKMEKMLKKFKDIFADADLKDTAEEAQIKKLQKIIDLVRDKVTEEEEAENKTTVDQGTVNLLKSIGQALSEMEAKFGIQ